MADGATFSNLSTGGGALCWFTRRHSISQLQPSPSLVITSKCAQTNSAATGRYHRQSPEGKNNLPRAPWVTPFIKFSLLRHHLFYMLEVDKAFQIKQNTRKQRKSHQIWFLSQMAQQHLWKVLEIQSDIQFANRKTERPGKLAGEIADNAEGEKQQLGGSDCFPYKL